MQTKIKIKHKINKMKLETLQSVGSFLILVPSAYLVFIMHFGVFPICQVSSIIVIYSYFMIITISQTLFSYFLFLIFSNILHFFLVIKFYKTKQNLPTYPPDLSHIEFLSE